MPGALHTDLYELQMAADYLHHGMTGPATFSLFVRYLPPSRGFLVGAGVRDAIDWLEQFSFESEDLAYLANLGFDDASLGAFRAMRFSGDVWAVPEGRFVFANEPLLEVTAPLPQAQLVETFLLNQISFQTALATKAARCRIAAAGRIHLDELGFRRTQGMEAALAVARLSAMVGFSATSNVEAARRYGLKATRTMAHSYVEAFPNEIDAFYACASDPPERTTFLVDTYDTLSGVAHAIEVIQRLGLEHYAAIRLDSGDVIDLAFQARHLLDAAGLGEVRIVASGGLDEHALARFVAAGAPIDVAGIGTRMGVSADAPYLDSVYKLVAYNGRPVAKLSVAKATLPGAKQVFRGPGFSDTIALRDEPVPRGAHAILEPVMFAGVRIAATEPMAAARARFESDLDELPAPVKDLVHPSAPVAEISPGLAQLSEEVLAAASRQMGTVARPSAPAATLVG